MPEFWMQPMLLYPIVYTIIFIFTIIQFKKILSYGDGAGDIVAFIGIPLAAISLAIGSLIFLSIHMYTAWPGFNLQLLKVLLTHILSFLLNLICFFTIIFISFNLIHVFFQISLFGVASFGIFFLAKLLLN